MSRRCAGCSIRRARACASQPFICGSQPAYADYIVFSPLQWARIVAPIDILEAGDALAAWRERMLDLYGGLGRTTPARA